MISQILAVMSADVDKSWSGFGFQDILKTVPVCALGEADNSTVLSPVFPSYKNIYINEYGTLESEAQVANKSPFGENRTH